MKKHSCSGCRYNFATLTMFDEHRVGEYSFVNNKGWFAPTPIGQSPRRCLTVDEMSIKGWLLRTLDVDVIIEGHGTRVPMSTWILPDQIEKRKQRVEKKRENARKS